MKMLDSQNKQAGSYLTFLLLIYKFNIHDTMDGQGLSFTDDNAVIARGYHSRFHPAQFHFILKRKDDFRLIYPF